MGKGKPQGRHKNIFNMHKQKTKAMPATKLIKMCAKLADCGTEGARRQQAGIYTYFQLI